MTIKGWFLDKNFSQNERYIINLAMMGDELETLKETEKAVQLRADSDFGTLTFWCPKSCILKDGEVDEQMVKKYQRMEAGLNYNEKLVAFAKENGIKGIRRGMKTQTLMRKITEAGLEIPARD